MYSIAFVLDISKMFLRIKLQHGTDYLKFFWRFCEKKDASKNFQNVGLDIWDDILAVSSH
jgi:hypothetical protein